MIALEGVSRRAHSICVLALLTLCAQSQAAGLSHFPDPMFHDGMEGSTAGPFNDADAARFLAQATFGPTDVDIAHLRSLAAGNGGAGYQAWLDEQFAATPTLMLDYYGWVTGTLHENPGDTTIKEAWLRGALGGTDPQNNSINHSDQLRQRVAFALSEIFVISEQNTMLDQNPDGQSYFYDVLVNNAFGNYRALLEQVTLSPTMGVYLNMIGNPRANLTLNQHPDENYAREVNQLFSIGLFMLKDDGTPVLSGGVPVATYGQAVVTAFAHVFTGWNWADWATYCGGAFWPCYPHGNDFITPMVAYPSYHDDGTHTDDMLNKQLLSYTGAQNAGLLVGGSAVINTPYYDLTFALDNIFHHPNVGPFISKQLIQRLVTSNPSPQYVQRVTAIFNNDGTGTRGNLGAVVKAILLDAEARYGQFWAPTTFGKLREPDLRVTHFWRAMNAVHICGTGFADGFYVNPYRYSGYSTGYGLGDTIYGSGVGQAVLNANTVFNFFRPDFIPSGEMAGLGLLGPEFQINTDTLISNSANSTFGKAIYYDTSDACTGPGNSYAGGPGEVAADRTSDAAFLTANGAAALIDKYNTRFMSGQMSPFMRQTLLTWMNSLGGTSKQRVNALLAMLLTSPEYMIQK